MFNPMDYLPQWHRDMIAETEAREAREWEAQQAERADRADTAMRMAEHHENMVQYRTGHSSAELRQAASDAATARELRNYQAEWGSAQRSAVFITGADGQMIPLQPREQATGPVTMSPDSITAQLNRARQQPGREFMQRQVAELERRQRDGRPVISRSEAGNGVTCLDCIEQGATAEESFLLHQDPDDPLPETRVPDHAPQRSGTGRKIPMIYR
jgi:hypothetical protein